MSLSAGISDIGGEIYQKNLAVKGRTSLLSLKTWKILTYREQV